MAGTANGLSSFRRQPGLGYGAVDEVPLNPFAFGTGKRSQILAGTARLDRGEFHGEPQAVHCGPWLCLSSMVLPSVRSPEFARKPTGHLGCEGIGCNDVHLNVIALWTFEQPVFETNRPRCHAFQHHPRLAAGTARAFNGREELLGRGHGASLHKAGALPDSQSPMIAIGGAVMSQPCSSVFRN